MFTNLKIIFIIFTFVFLYNQIYPWMWILEIFFKVQ